MALRGMPTPPDTYLVPCMKPGRMQTPWSGYVSVIACSALRLPWKYPDRTKPAKLSHHYLSDFVMVTTYEHTGFIVLKILRSWKDKLSLKYQS